MRTFIGKRFAKFASRERIGEDAIRRTVAEFESGLVGADLGGGVYKKRMPRSGGGKSGGYRIVLFVRIGDRMLFADGFAKNVNESLSVTETLVLRKLAMNFLKLDQPALDELVRDGILMELP